MGEPRLVHVEALERAAAREGERERGAVEHPLVRTHTETGEKSLYANAAFTSHIVGMSQKESDLLLAQIFRESTVPEYQCRFKWEKNSIAFWDNRATWHSAQNDYQGQRRIMHRTTINGAGLRAFGLAEAPAD